MTGSFWGLEVSIPGCCCVGKFGKYFSFVRLDLSRDLKGFFFGGGERGVFKII